MGKQVADGDLFPLLCVPRRQKFAEIAYGRVVHVERAAIRKHADRRSREVFGYGIHVVQAVGFLQFSATRFAVFVQRDIVCVDVAAFQKPLRAIEKILHILTIF